AVPVQRRGADVRLPGARGSCAAGRVAGRGAAAEQSGHHPSPGHRHQPGAVDQPVALGRSRLTPAGAGLLAVALVPLGFLAVFFVWPVVPILQRGLSASGGVLPVLGSAETWHLVAFTLGQAVASTALAVLAGLPVAFLLARCALPGLGFVRVAVLVPFVL